MVPARRPPNTNARIGTPCGSSHASSSAGFKVAGEVNREFGCAAFVPASGVQSFPCQSIACAGFGSVHPLPPHVSVVGEGDVREDRVGADRLHPVRVRRIRRAGRDPEVAGLRIDREQAAVLAWFDPRDVVADRGHLPALVGERRRRDEHREVRLAARARERRRDIRLLPLRIRHTQDEHVLGEPPVVARHRGRDPQGEALLAQQRVAAVAGPVRPDLQRLREVHDVLLGRIARPRDILLALAPAAPRRCACTARTRRRRRAPPRPHAPSGS